MKTTPTQYSNSHKLPGVTLEEDNSKVARLKESKREHQNGKKCICCKWT